jgi:hypothetical protein
MTRRPLRTIAALGVALILAACAAGAPYATDNEIAAVSYRDTSGPRTLTLVTVVNNRTGAGGHSSLIINGSQQVIFDPAGSFYHSRTPERNDVLYGVTPAMAKGYLSAHARSTHHVVTQTVEVTAAQAETALRLAEANGPVPGAFCASATSSLLRQVPGFENVRSTYYPVELSDSFAQLPGVRRDALYEDDDADLQKALAAAQD